MSRTRTIRQDRVAKTIKLTREAYDYAMSECQRLEDETGATWSLGAVLGRAILSQRKKPVEESKAPEQKPEKVVRAAGR